MKLERRGFLLGVTSLSACSAGRLQQQQPDWLAQPWFTRPLSTVGTGGHHNQGGRALSPDGRFLALALPGRPMSELAVVDLDRGLGWSLKSPDPRVMLAEPAFSPDGRTLALVATPNISGRPYGIGEIWLVDRAGGSVRVLGAPNQTYRHPSFSPDGAKLACFRDVQTGAPVRAGYMRPEYREFHNWALFEIDLRTGAETNLDPQPFSFAGGLFHDPQGRGLFYRAMWPNQRRGAIWDLPPQLESYERSTAYNRAFLKRWGEPIGPEPRPFTPVDHPLTRGAHLCGVTAEGRAFLQNGAVDPRTEKTRPFGVFYDGARVGPVFEPEGVQITGLTCSLSGRIFGGHLASSDILAIRYFLSAPERKDVDFIDLAGTGLARDIRPLSPQTGLTRKQA